VSLRPVHSTLTVKYWATCGRPQCFCTQSDNWTPAISACSTLPRRRFCSAVEARRPSQDSADDGARSMVVETRIRSSRGRGWTRKQTLLILSCRTRVISPRAVQRERARTRPHVALLSHSRGTWSRARHCEACQPFSPGQERQQEILGRQRRIPWVRMSPARSTHQDDLAGRFKWWTSRNAL
jgi:hypothetical protein